MTKRLRDYQVLDVLYGGTFYKVRHKVTNNIFAWKAYDCSAYSDEQIQNVINEVKTISEAAADNILRYYDTILHAPSKTLYFVLEFNTWRSVDELISLCMDTDKYVAESFIWYLLYELARICKFVEDLKFVVLQKCISAASVYIDDGGALRVNCFDLSPCGTGTPALMRQVGKVVHSLCYRTRRGQKIQEFHYSDDLQDVICFLVDDKNANLRPDVILYHPTVLANLEMTAGTKKLSEILVSSLFTSVVNKCDSEKAVELCRAVEPAPRSNIKVFDSPTYANVTPKKFLCIRDEVGKSVRASLSPTIAALALELPGFVPRSRQPITDAIATYNDPQHISEKTLSQQWMSRLIALRHREESLNKRERHLISKEIINSPATKIIPLNDTQELDTIDGSNGITLPTVITAAKDEPRNGTTRRHHRSSSVRTRKQRKSYAYEDMDSSLSADPGDDSMVITSRKLTSENMPRRNIFPDISAKKVHFTSANPFTESDESVTLTFYELDTVDRDGYQVPRTGETGPISDITKFKYLDLEKTNSEKRVAMQKWNHSSPSKQAKTSKRMFADITNQGNMRRTPSKTSIASKTSNSSNGTQCSVGSTRSVWSMQSMRSKVSDGNISDRTRSSRQSLAPAMDVKDIKKPKTRKSLMPFKTPFKFMSSKVTNV